LRSNFPNHFVATNFGNGILGTFWWGDSGELETAVQAVDVCSSDQYMYTSPGVRNNAVNPYGDSTPCSGWPLAGGSGNVSLAQRSGSYGWMITRQRAYSQGNLHPFGVFIETQMPFLTDSGREIILYAQIRGAVWSSLCNEARMINYFQHNGMYTGGAPTTDPNTGASPNTTTYSLVNGDAALKSYVTTLNAQVRAHAPMLNTQSYSFNFGATGVTTMLKGYNGYAYIFTSMALGATTGSKTFTLTGSGITGTSVEVVDESRSINVSGGQFTDTFSNEYSHHIYKVLI
jgi:hypothetical protein